MMWCLPCFLNRTNTVFWCTAGKFLHNLMEKKDFEAWLDNISITFLSLTDLQKNETLDHLISLSGAVQLRHLSNNLEILLKRDFLKLLPLELSFYLLKWLDPHTLLTCCLVSKQWNKVISACTEVWQTACKNLGWQIDDSVQDPLHWKKVYLKAILRMKQLKDHEAFETSSLIGHSARVYALYYRDGLLCTGRKFRKPGVLLFVISTPPSSCTWLMTNWFFLTRQIIFTMEIQLKAFHLFFFFFPISETSGMLSSSLKILIGRKKKKKTTTRPIYLLVKRRDGYSAAYCSSD